MLAELELIGAVL